MIDHGKRTVTNNSLKNKSKTKYNAKTGEYQDLRYSPNEKSKKRRFS